MSRWLRRIWGGMRLCGNTAPIEQVATKQREVFRRLCNMYTVTWQRRVQKALAGLSCVRAVV